MTTTKDLTIRQKALIEAIDRGVTTLRDLMAIADYSSISVVKYNLEQLAQRGLVAMELIGGDRLQAYSGREFCAAWNAAARLAGNVNA